MSALSWVEVSKSRLLGNHAIFRALAGAGRELLLVVKADAYGHGLAEVSRLLVAEGQRWFGVHSPEEALAWEVVAGAVEGFKSADKIVISSPMWNFGIPYRLKQYLDVIVQPGLTFSFSPDAGYSGLVTGRPAMLILARGGEYPAGSEAAAFDFQRPYLETVLRFIGFSDIKAVVVEPTIQAGPEAADKRLAAAVENARKMADSF